MEYTVFYAWQSDGDEKTNRYLIRDCLDSALKKINKDITVEDAPRLDHDTKGVAGTPEITGSIFSKIDACGLFVADVTLVGSISPHNPDRPNKKTANPNVILELGYAAAKVGWDRIILVMNEYYGRAEEQVFDLRNRRYPLVYELDPANLVDKKTEQKRLEENLDLALRASTQSEYATVDEIIASLDLTCLQILRSMGGYESFGMSIPRTMGDVLSNVTVHSAYRHLFSSKVIKAEFNGENQSFVCRWTYLGMRVLIRLGIRSK